MMRTDRSCRTMYDWRDVVNDELMTHEVLEAAHSDKEGFFLNILKYLNTKHFQMIDFLRATAGSRRERRSRPSPRVRAHDRFIF